MNIILIVSDTFRRDHLGCYGNNWIHTPNLDTFAKRAIVFDRAYAASFPTLPNRHDIYTGQFTFAYSKWAPLPKDEVVLAQLLRQVGFVTQLIVDTPHMLKDGFNYDRGFDGWWWIRGQEDDRYMNSPREVRLPCDPHKLRGGASVVTQYLRNVSMRRFESDYFVAQTMAAAANWLELNYDQHEKFFLHIDTFDPHEPWDPPKYYVDMYDPGYEGGEVIYPRYGHCGYLTEEELNHCRALYAAEVTMVDRWIGRLLQKIEDLGLLENTVVIFTSDHGFYLGEHNLIGKTFDHLSGGSVPLYEEVTRIPLMIRLLGSEGGKRCKALVQPPDLTPTILEIAGTKAQAPRTMQGLSLLPLLMEKDVTCRDFAVTSSSIIDGPIAGYRITMTTDEWSLIYRGQVEDVLRDRPGWRMNLKQLESKVGKIENELYHLSKDPKQTHNVFNDQKNIAEQLHLKLVKFLETIGTKEEYLKYWKKLE